MHDLVKLIKQTEELEKSALLQRADYLSGAMNSGSVSEMMKAQQYWENVNRKRNDPGARGKAFLFDPLELSVQKGWKQEKINYIDPSVYRVMAEVPYVRAILDTRIDQMVNYLDPQPNRYSPGLVVQKIYYGQTEDRPKPTDQDKVVFEEIIEFLLNCGTTARMLKGNKKAAMTREWSNDINLEIFVRKVMWDSFSLDKMAFEVVENVGGGLHEFYGVDGATIYIADDYRDKELYSEEERLKAEKNGFFPDHVQVINNEILAEFYPWELCFGIRNRRTALYSNGYGSPELKSLVNTVTSLLNGDTYNANYFKVGSAPKGILKVKGSFNQGNLEDFKQQWEAMMQGVMNAHKLPVLNSDRAEFINTHVTNRDMEFSLFMETQFRLSCALFKISPTEIPLFRQMQQGGGGMGGIQSGSSRKEELKYSKEKGLKPNLKFLARNINKYIVGRFWPGYEVLFAGHDVETAEKELERDIKRVTYFNTINQVLESRGEAGIGKRGDIILHPIYMQALMMQNGMNGGGADRGNTDIMGVDVPGFGSENGKGDAVKKGEDGFDDDDANPILENFNVWFNEVNG